MVNSKKQETREKWDSINHGYLKSLQTIKKLPKHMRESYFTNEIPTRKGTTRPIKGWKQLNNQQRHSLMDIDF